MIKILFVSIVTAGILNACSKSEFVPDDDNALLPEYSSSGRNIAGALINDTVWQSRLATCFACRVWRFYVISDIDGDSTTFILQGAYSRTSIGFTEGSPDNISTDFYFVVKGLKIENQDSLFKLANKTFTFDSLHNYAGISKYSLPLNNKGKGTFTIMEVKKRNEIRYGDGTPGNPFRYKYILSGRFNLESYFDRYYMVKDGRFDNEILQGTNLYIN